MTDKTLPFKLSRKHKGNFKYQWKKRGMIFTDEDFEYIYQQYIYCKNCDLCNKEFKSSLDRHLDHDHNTGEVRNIVCNKCNSRKKDNMSNTNTKEKHIHKIKLRSGNYSYLFVIRIRLKDNTRKYLVHKYSQDIDYLVKFRDNWVKENNYYT